MIDLVWEVFSNIIRQDVLITIALGGYACFLIAFFEKDEQSLWKSLGWGERVLLGFLWGILVWLFMAVPLTVFAASFFEILPIEWVYQWGTVLTASVFLFLIFMLASGRNITQKPVHSLESKSMIRENLEQYVPNLITAYLCTLFFFVIPTVFSYFGYSEYPFFFESWYKAALASLITPALPGVGLYLLNIVLTEQRIDIVSLIRNGSRLGRKTSRIARYWLLIYLVLISATAWVLVETDRTSALFIPIYERSKAEVHSLIYLFREPDGPAVFAKETTETIVVRTPLFVPFQYLIIRNMGNLSIQPRLETKPRIAYGSSFDIELVDGFQFIRLKNVTELSRWEEYNFTLTYYSEVKPNVDIDRSFSQIHELENGTKSIIYTLVIINHESQTVYSHQKFAAAHFVRDLHIPEGAAYNLMGYTNGTRIDHVHYLERAYWFHPYMAIGPNRQLNYTYVFYWNLPES